MAHRQATTMAVTVAATALWLATASAGEPTDVLGLGTDQHWLWPLPYAEERRDSTRQDAATTSEASAKPEGRTGEDEIAEEETQGEQRETERGDPAPDATSEAGTEVATEAARNRTESTEETRADEARVDALGTKDGDRSAADKDPATVTVDEAIPREQANEANRDWSAEIAALDDDGEIEDFRTNGNQGCTWADVSTELTSRTWRVLGPETLQSAVRRWVRRERGSVEMEADPEGVAETIRLRNAAETTGNLLEALEWLHLTLRDEYAGATPIFQVFSNCIVRIHPDGAIGRERG